MIICDGFIRPREQRIGLHHRRRASTAYKSHISAHFFFSFFPLKTSRVSFQRFKFSIISSFRCTSKQEMDSRDDLGSLSSLDDHQTDLMMAVDEDDRCSPCPSSISSASSSTSIRIRRDRSDCQLSWSDHQSYLTAYFDSLYRLESMVDVTLVCPDLSVRAHRVVLSACR